MAEALLPTRGLPPAKNRSMLIAFFLVLGALAASPAHAVAGSCSGPATIAGPHTILLDPADTGGYTVVFSACTVTGSLTIDSTAAGVPIQKAIVEIQNSVADTFAIAPGVRLGACSRIRIRGLSGVTAATLAGSAQDGAEILFSFVTIIGSGLVVAGTYTTQSRLVVDLCNITTTSGSSALTVASTAVFANGSHFNITNSVIASTGAAAMLWDSGASAAGSSAGSSAASLLHPTTLVALVNTSLSGRGAFVMDPTAPGIQKGALLLLGGGSSFAVLSSADYHLALQMGGGLLYHDPANQFGPGPAGNISINVTENSTGLYMALRGVSIGHFGWLRTANLTSTNDTLILEDSSVAAGITVEVGLATGLNLTLRRVVATGAVAISAQNTLTDSSILVEDSALVSFQQQAPALRTSLAVLRTNISSSLVFDHPATESPLRISRVEAVNVTITQRRVSSPIRIEDIVLTETLIIWGLHTDSGATVVRATAAQHLLLSSDLWLRSPLFVEDAAAVGGIFQISATHVDGRMQLNRITAGCLRLAAGTGLVRTALLVHNSLLSTSLYAATMLLENAWDAAALDVLNTTAMSTGQLFTVYIANPPLNGSQHRFADSVLASTTTTYPASGTEPLQGVLVYAAGFGSGGLLEVRGTRLEAQHASTYLVYVEVSGSRLHFDGSNACARSGGAPNSGRLHMRTLVAGAGGDVVRVNNSEVDKVVISLSNGTDSDVSIENSTVRTTFTLTLAGPQTGLVHRMLNTTVGGAVVVTAAGDMVNNTVVLVAVRAASVTHNGAITLSGSRYTLCSSKVTGPFSLTAALLTQAEVSVDSTAISGAATVTAGKIQNTSLRFTVNTFYSLVITGMQTNTSITADGNTLTNAFGFDGPASFVTWRIQNNTIKGGYMYWSAATLVRDGMVAILNNTMSPKGSFLMNNGGGAGPGTTVLMRDNRLTSFHPYNLLSLQLQGGRLDHDGSNVHRGGGYMLIYLKAADAPATTEAGGNFFLLGGSQVTNFLWERTAGLAAAVNETIVLATSTFGSLQVKQGLCLDCRLVIDQCTTSNCLLTGTRITSSSSSPNGTFVMNSTTAMLPSTSLRCSVCMLSSSALLTFSIGGTFEGPSSALLLLNSTFPYGGSVNAAFTVENTSSVLSGSPDLVIVDIANCSFGGNVILGSSFSVVAPNTTASIYIRDTVTTISFTVSVAPLGDNMRLIIQNVKSLFTCCATFVALDLKLVGDAWVELWNTTFFRGDVRIAATSAAANIRLMGNSVESFTITGALASVGGGRLAACNRNTAIAGWPPLAVSALGFSNLACLSAQTVTRCAASSGMTVAVTSYGSDVTLCPASFPDAGITMMTVATLPPATSTGPAMGVVVCPVLWPPSVVMPGISPPSAWPLPALPALATHEHLAPSANLSGVPACHLPTKPTPSVTTSLPASTLSTSVTPSMSVPPSTPSTAVTTSATPPASTPTRSHGSSASAPAPHTATTGVSVATSTPAGTPTTAVTSSTSVNRSPKRTPARPLSASVSILSTPHHITAATTPPMVLPPNSTTACTGTDSHHVMTSAAVIVLDRSSGSASQNAFYEATFPLPTSSSGGSSSGSLNTTAGRTTITPVWRPTSGGSTGLAQWFVADVGPLASCTADPTLAWLACRFPAARSLPSSLDDGSAAAATVEATVRFRPCPAAPVRLMLSLVRQPLTPGASTATVVIISTGLAGSTAYALLAEPWAVEPLVLVGILDGPCAPPAIQDTARIAVYILNPFAALDPAAAGGLLVGLVALVVICQLLIAAATAAHSRNAATPTPVPPPAGKQASLRTLFVGKALFPRVAFAVAVAAVPGVAWAAAASIRGGPAGAAIVGVLVSAAYLLAVPAVGALVVMRLAPAHFTPWPVRPSKEGLWRRVLLPTGRWTVGGCGGAEVPAAMNVRGLTAGPRGGELLFVGSSLLATGVFALLIAPPASTSCATRHYIAAGLFFAAALLVVCLRPHRVLFTTGLTTLILLLAGACTAAIGAAPVTSGSGGDDPVHPTNVGPSAALATAVVLLSIARSIHAAAMPFVTNQGKMVRGIADDDEGDANHHELGLTSSAAKEVGM